MFIFQTCGIFSGTYSRTSVYTLVVTEEFSENKEIQGILLKTHSSPTIYHIPESFHLKVKYVHLIEFQLKSASVQLPPFRTSKFYMVRSQYP